MPEYCIYLRKSRADVEAEARGEGETLARHEKALTELSRRMHYPVTHIYREIVSGESIANRPQMQQLLADVSARRYAGVLVMEVERLARGDTTDQAVVASTFKFSGTLIITPFKTYDPNNTMDEEYFEFSLFMSRREYKTIVRRMQTGRKLAAAEGRYIATRPPFGYRRVKLPSGEWSLEIVPEEAEIVRNIFAWHIAGDGGTRIATRLTRLGIPSPFGSAQWWQTTVHGIIRNPVYIGRITWDKKTDAVIGLDEYGRKIHKRQSNPNHTNVPGKHPPIIDEVTFAIANNIHRQSTLPVRNDQSISNPLAGLVRCALCGHTMTRNIGGKKPSGGRYPDRLACKTPGCPTCGTSIELIERSVLRYIEMWPLRYANAPASPADPNAAEIARLTRQLAQFRAQQSKLCDFLERGLYDEQTFTMRAAALRASIAATTARLEALQLSSSEPTIEDRIRAVLPRIPSALAAYRTTSDPSTKNEILRQLIDHIDFSKTAHGSKSSSPADSLHLIIYPAHASSQSV